MRSVVGRIILGGKIIKIILIIKIGGKSRCGRYNERITERIKEKCNKYFAQTLHN